MQEGNLVPPLEQVPLVEEVEPAEQLTIFLTPDGRVTMRGEHELILEFVRHCRRRGLYIDLQLASPCG
ncbi:MAG: hypothetical protein JXA37_04155 [Chloroflexia bacterium]|nr:hypothetical protein [Chloroflexia bacterium]